MSALDDGKELRSSAAALLETVKAELGVLSVADAHQLYSVLRETEGDLLSCRRFLEPEGMPRFLGP